MVRATRMGGGSGGGGGSGTVTSVALAMPAIFSVAGSPVTTAGTITVTLATETANTVFAGPTTGAAAAPTFRALVAADYPTMGGDAGAGGTKGAVPAPAAGDAAAGKFLKADGTWAVPSGSGGGGWTTGTGTVYLTTITDKVGIGNATPTQPITVGTGGSMSSGNTSVVILRAFTQALDSGDNQGHGFSDCSTINVTTNTFAYASLDVKTVFTGSATYDHFAGLQINPTLGSSGTTGTMYGFVHTPVINSGTVTTMYGIRLNKPSGTGAFANGIGLYVEEMTAGTTTNYAAVLYGISVCSKTSNAANTDVLWVQNAGGSDATSASIVLQAYGDTTTPTCRISGRRLGNGIFGIDLWTFDGGLGCTKAVSIDDLGNTMALRGVLGGKGLNQPIVTKTANYTIVRRTDYTVLADTAGGNFTITLPASPTAGDIYIVRKVSASNTLTIARNGKNINGAASDLSVTTDGEVNRLQYDSTSGSWWTI